MLSLSQAAVLIFAPTLYILLSCCALAQFRLLLHGLATAAWHAQRSPGLDTVAPGASLPHTASRPAYLKSTVRIDTRSSLS